MGVTHIVAPQTALWNFILSVETRTRAARIDSIAKSKDFSMKLCERGAPDYSANQ
jgi:hypothetical protein